MAITQFTLPVPTITDPVNFAQRADTLVSELPRFVNESNDLALEMNLYATYGPGAALAPSGFKNKIINGGMMVAQSPNITLTNAPQYGPVDMMQLSISGGTGITGTVQQVVSSGFNSGYTLGAIGASWTNGIYFLQHRIEAANTKTLNGKTITVQAVVMHDSGSNKNFAFSISKANSLNNFGATTVISSNFGIKAIPHNTPTLITGSITLGPNDADNGLEIVLYSEAHTVVNKNYYVGAWQLEVGAIATAFESQEFGAVKRACCNYYRTGTGLRVDGYSSTTTTLTAIKSFEPMRATPVIAFYNTTYSGASGITLIASSPDGFSASATGTTAGANSNFITSWTASCRL